MATYGGFDPGTFQPWALNIEQNALGTAGIARGLVVTPATPASMNVSVGVDAVQGDGICFLPNGAWLRIDAVLSLSVPNNTSGSSRTDAVVAFVDPTGVANPSVSLTYQTSWSGGFKGGTTNQFVLALVTVPNGASSIVAANIVNTAFQASVGSASPNLLDSVVSDNTPGAQQTRIFTQYGVTVAPSATNGQTSFAIPLTSMQRLVPMGRIGGGDEIGYFSGPSGWYVPKLFGSTSGPLPVASVDYVGGNILTAAGAVAGEVVVASFKYYDFARDLSVWTGTMLLQRNSPYLVYQGDVHPSGTHLTTDVWDGTLNAYAPATPGMAIVCTYFGQNLVPHFAPWQTTNQYSWAVDGGAATTVTPWSNMDVGVYGYGNSHGPGGTVDGIHQLVLTYVTGLFDFAGVDVCCVQPGVYVDGGVAVVGGYTVNVGNTSLQLIPPAQGYASVLYVDRYGNVTASSRPQVVPFGEALGVRVPLAQAVQYVPMNNTTTLYGTYASPNTPKGLTTLVTLGNNHGGNSSLASGTSPHSWKLVQDVYSPTGGVWQTTASQDGLIVSAPLTGLDLVMSLSSTAGFNVNVDNVTAYRAVVAGTAAGPRVRLTCASSWPVGSHTVRVYLDTTYGGTTWGPEFAEVRYPELPTPPSQTLPLAGLLSDGAGVLGSYGTFSIVKDVLHDAQFQGGAGTFQLLNDFAHMTPGPMVLMANTSTNQQWVQAVHTSGAVRVLYEGYPGGGKFNVVVDGISTYATVDTFVGIGTYAPRSATAPLYLPGGLHTIACQATGTKNTSSSGLTVILQGIEYIPPTNLALDASRFGPDGIRPSVRGSAILGQKGDYLLDQGPGVGTLHLQDRAVSSRKMTPTWARAITQTAWSGSGGLDPYLMTSLTVETPSVLDIRAMLTSRLNAACGGIYALSVDGVQQEILNGGTLANGQLSVYNPSVAQGAGGAMAFPVTLNDLVPVGPGTHTVGVQLNAYGAGGVPYVDAFNARTLTVIAYAL